MPLVLGGGADLVPGDELSERARKVLPRFARGEPRRVAVGRNLPDAELIQGILLEEGIPSFLRRSSGFDVPDFLAGGPRDVLVPASGADAARELLAIDGEGAFGVARGAEAPRRTAIKLAAGMLAGLLLFSALAGLIYALS